jgi:hypothetical protein
LVIGTPDLATNLNTIRRRSTDDYVLIFNFCSVTRFRNPELLAFLRGSCCVRLT